MGSVQIEYETAYLPVKRVIYTDQDDGRHHVVCHLDGVIYLESHDQAWTLKTSIQFKSCRDAAEFFEAAAKLARQKA